MSSTTELTELHELIGKPAAVRDIVGVEVRGQPRHPSHCQTTPNASSTTSTGSTLTPRSWSSTLGVTRPHQGS